MNSDHKKGMLAALTTIIMWSSTYSGIKLTVNYFSPEVLALYRFLIASLVLALFLWIKKKGLPEKKDWLLFLLTGFVGISVYMILYNSAQKEVGAGTAAFLLGITPVLTSFIAYFYLKEKLNWIGWIGILISFGGVALIGLGEGRLGGSFGGILKLVAVGFLLSFYNIWVRKLSKKYNSLQITGYSFVIGTVFLLVFVPGLTREWAQAPLHIHLSVVYLGIFPAAVGYLFWSYALSKGNTAQISSFMYLTPFLTLIVSWFWIHETTAFISVLGGIVILGGVFLTNFIGKAYVRKSEVK